MGAEARLRRPWVLKEVLQSKPERWALGQKSDQQWGSGGSQRTIRWAEGNTER